MSDFKAKLEQLLIDADAELTMNGNLYLEPTDGLLEVRKLSAYAPVSCCQLTDATGENHCGHPPYVSPPIPWRTKVRMRLRTWRVRAGSRIGSWLAGERLLTQDEADDLREDW